MPRQSHSISVLYASASNTLDPRILMCRPRRRRRVASSSVSVPSPTLSIWMQPWRRLAVEVAQLPAAAREIRSPEPVRATVSEPLAALTAHVRQRIEHEVFGTPREAHQDHVSG